MDTLKWEKEKKSREKASLEKHTRLSELFRKDRFAFEQERKRMINEVINSAEDEGQRKRLKNLQASWDKKMRGAGSRYNRLVLAQTFFWDHFYENWLPAIKRFDLQVNSKSVRPSLKLVK